MGANTWFSLLLDFLKSLALFTNIVFLEKHLNLFISFKNVALFEIYFSAVALFLSSIVTFSL